MSAHRRALVSARMFAGVTCRSASLCSSMLHLLACRASAIQYACPNLCRANIKLSICLGAGLALSRTQFIDANLSSTAPSLAAYHARGSIDYDSAAILLQNR